MNIPDIHSVEYEIFFVEGVLEGTIQKCNQIHYTDYTCSFCGNLEYVFVGPHLDGCWNRRQWRGIAWPPKWTRTT